MYKKDQIVISLQIPIHKAANNLKQKLLKFLEYLIRNTAVQAVLDKVNLKT